MSMNVSFGIEFEFDVIKSDGSKIRHMFEDGYRFIRGWNYQSDHTAGVELRSPVWTGLDEAIIDIRDQFSYWCDVLNSYAPYAYNSEGRSLGMHIHIGVPDRGLLRSEKQAIAKACANVYPFLAALQAQPIPSHRGLTTTFARPIWRYNWRFPNEDHYCEISDSYHGTVEFRLFDSNIPQVALVNAWFLQKISERVLSDINNGNELGIRLYRERYIRDREAGLRYGVGALDIRRYLQYIENLIGDVELPSYPFFREILYLAVKYGLNPYGVLSQSRVNEYYYFKRMFCNPDKFLENILGLMNVSGNERLYEMLNDAFQNAPSISRVSDLIALVSRREGIPLTVFAIPEHSRELPSRSYVKACIETGNYGIVRIFQVPNMSPDVVAERISYLLRYHGGRYVREMKPEEVIEAPQRFYVFIVKDENSDRYVVIGTIAVRVRTGEVSSLVVDRRYRRLGIAKRLLQFVRTVSERPLYGYVRRGNEAMINLLRSMSFELREYDDRILLFREPEGGGE
jgi:ribosomal protein S18 acetylase RimI-like enzyme